MEAEGLQLARKNDLVLGQAKREEENSYCQLVLVAIVVIAVIAARVGA